MARCKTDARGALGSEAARVEAARQSARVDHVTLLERLGVELPIVQAGMGGGLSRHRLAAAVSAAGGLGTIGILPPRQLRREIFAVRSLTSRPVAVNLLLPIA